MLVRRMLLGAFRPRTTREIKKSQPLSVAEGPRRCWLGICSSPLHKGVILSEARRGSIAYHRLMARSRRTPAMLVGQMLLGAFRPRTTREIKKVTASEL